MAHELIIQIAERNEAGRQAEAEGDTQRATTQYEENIKADYADAFAFERLMIIYRKEKRYKDELRVIKRGIRVFTDHNQNQLKKLQAGQKNKKQVSELSSLFMTKAGLKDKKGNSTYYPEPVNKWMKRKETVEKKLK